LPVEIIKAPIDLPAEAPPPQERHSGILVKEGEAKLRIADTPDPQTLQQLLR